MINFCGTDFALVRVLLFETSALACWSLGAKSADLLMRIYDEYDDIVSEVRGREVNLLTFIIAVLVESPFST